MALEPEDLTSTTCAAPTPDGTAQAAARLGFGLGFGLGLGAGFEVGLAVAVGVLGFRVRVAVVVRREVRVAVVVVVVVVVADAGVEGVGVVLVDDRAGAALEQAPSETRAMSSEARYAESARGAAYLRVALACLALLAELTGRSAGSRGWTRGRPSAGPGW